MIENRISPKDGRGQIYTLTEAGISRVRDIRKTFLRLAETACQTLATRDLELAVSVFERYLGLHPREDFFRDHPSLRIEVLDGIQVVPELRFFVMERLVRSRRALT